MHPVRFKFLAGKHAQNRHVTARARTNSGSWVLELECGHVGQCVAHMDCSKTQTWRCYPCGETYVKAAPEYAKEFLETA